MEIEKYIILSDAQLVVLALDGDSEAFETLLKRYREEIYALCITRTAGNKEDANDLVQETFVKVFINLEKYDPKYTFGQWIYTIARNTFVDFSRSRKSNALNPQNLSPEIDNTAQSSSPTPEDYIINAQQRAQIERYISMLPEDYRQLFELRFLDEYSYEEIAEKLDMKLGTVKTRIFRVRNMMCRLITEGEEQTKKQNNNG